MFDNIGKKIQAVAKAVAFIGIASSVIVGLAALMQSLAGLLIIVGGGLLSWVGSFMTYGFGVLVEQAEVSLGKTELSKNQKSFAEQEMQHTPDWTCTYCGERNPLGVHKCTKCGRG